jgi:hypothetical protein
MDAGRVVINPLIYAEVSVGYQTVVFPDHRHHRPGSAAGGRE